jgi:surfeit locus 1 family protein
MPRRFRPALVPTIGFLLLLPALIGLGIWQLDRAAQKRALQTLYEARESGAAVALGGDRQRPATLRYRRVRFQGYYDQAHTILLDNRVHEGVAGYNVVTPVRIRGTRMHVLVNRGWVPMGSSRSKLPDVDAPAGLQTIVGVATVPVRGVFRLASPPPLGPTWQKVWEHLDLARYAKAVKFPVQPVEVLLDPASPAGGYVREWKRPDTGIAMHQGYAVQWFVMAAVLVIIYFFRNFRPVEAASGRDDQTDGYEA